MDFVGKMRRVSRLGPCPICGQPDWCLVDPQGTMAICPRTPEGAIKDLGEAGYLHEVHPDHVTPHPAPHYEPQNTVKVDFKHLSDIRRERAEPRLHDLARTLQQQDKPINHHTRHRRIGEGYSLNYLQEQHITLAEVNADHWKSWVHQRFETPLDQPGAMTLFQAPSHEHLSLAKHLTSERKIEDFLPGRGVVTRWERIRKNNHWFDALYHAYAVGHASGVRLLEEERIKPQPRRKMSEMAEDNDASVGSLIMSVGMRYGGGGGDAIEYCVKAFLWNSRLVQ